MFNPFINTNNMKAMKKYLLALAAVLCCAMTTAVFTSCNNDDDDTVFGEYYTETAGINMAGEVICVKMDEALVKAFGNKDLYKLDDNKAIRVCDEVANEYREELAGVIYLRVHFGSTDPDAENNKMIKQYLFPF